MASRVHGGDDLHLQQSADQEAELPQTTDDLIAAQDLQPAARQVLFVYNAKADIYASAAWFQGTGVTLVTPDGTTEVASETVSRRPS